MPEEKRQTLEGGGTVFDSNKYPTDMHRPSQVVIVSRLFNWLLLLFTVVMGMCVCGGGGEDRIGAAASAVRWKEASLFKKRKGNS